MGERQDGVIRALLDAIHGSNIIKHESPEVAEVRIGVFYTGVRLSTGHAGVAYTPVHDMPPAVCCPRSHAKMPEAGRLVTKGLDELLSYAGDGNPLRSALGVATINALSALIVDKVGHGHREHTYADALDLVQVTEKDTVVMIGAFPPFIKKVRDEAGQVHVLERNLAALDGEAAKLLEPADRAAAVLPEADVVIASGTTVINGTLPGILAMSARAREFVLVGPTASMLPDPLFSMGVTVMGGIRIHDPARLMLLVSEGGSGYDFFTECAAKVAIRRAAVTARLEG